MPEIWTLSGINNQEQANGPFVDYVGNALLAKIPSLKPKHIARRYPSQLGVKSHYPDERNVLTPAAMTILNAEATAIAQGLMPDAKGIEEGEMTGRNVHVILLAPKTNRYPNKQPSELQIYWGTYDAVPNQGIFLPDSLAFWRKWTSNVFPLKARHDLNDYLVTRPQIVKRSRKRRPNNKPTGPRYKYIWKPTGKTAPCVLETVDGWLTNLPNDDLVLVGHSQGTNIAMHLLARGLG